jgi:hypothetical protein
MLHPHARRFVARLCLLGCCFKTESVNQQSQAKFPGLISPAFSIRPRDRSHRGRSDSCSQFANDCESRANVSTPSGRLLMK